MRRLTQIHAIDAPSLPSMSSTTDKAERVYQEVSRERHLRVGSARLCRNSTGPIYSLECRCAEITNKEKQNYIMAAAE